jgi:hypothetical protein
MEPWNGMAPINQPEFPISTLSLRENHMSATLACQVQIDMAAHALHRGSFSPFR